MTTSWRERIPRKVAVVVVTVAVAAVSRVIPGAAAWLPVELLTDLALALLAAHTVTDVTAVLGTFAVEYALARREPNEPRRLTE